jgi:DNA-binding SARP family transcriptional activator/tRNA A-37 threonylcarbamoyl transferase component Bud32/WD40 repeat protein/molybdopterin-guanine dinucleotide biosynthesis protein
MRFRVLGQVHVERDGDAVALGGPQQRRLLALLLSERGRVVTTERIVEALWADGEEPDAASRSAMKYVSRLRAVLGETVIATVGAGYRLELDGNCCDVDEFEMLVDAAGRDMPDVAVGRYDAALELWRGPAFGEFSGEWWALPEASRLAERRVAAEVARAATHMAMGHHNRAIPELERLAVEHPLDERPVRLLIQGLCATGRQVEALRVGREFRRRLVGETGLDPSADLARMEAAIAAGDPSPGSSVGRPLRGYTIHDAIGEGAHGRVYVATQPGTERRVAIKVIRPDLADSTEFVHRFEAEARLVARLEHPHIVPLYDYWREPGGAYLVFRLLSGGTARDSVISGGPWSLPRVSRLVDEIGGALMSAHVAGVAHNDVKASNVLLDDGGAAYLTDFGIAVTADDPSEGVARDIRGLGWLAWELLSGSRPSSARTRSSLDGPGAVDGVPSLVGRMPSVPDGLDAVLRRAIDGGYASVAEVLLAWRAAAGDADGQHSPIRSDARRAAARQLAAAVTAGVNPYHGLRPFDEADAASFHGRDGVVADLVELVAAQRFVTVVGSSGSGKSSVVLAGLVPRLRAGGAVVVTMIPGDAPLEALHTALREVATVADAVDQGQPADALVDVARGAGQVIVVVDQFEECWTRAREEDRDAFLDLAARAVADGSIDVRFVTTVRADLLDRPLEHPTIGALVGAGSHVLAPLSPVELEEAIVQPAARAGVAFDDGVVADLIADAVTYPGSLPLLQFTLTELYDRRKDAIIGRHALEEIGGMAGAVGRRAEEVFAGLDETLRGQARALFGRLVAPGRSAPDTRRRARLGELSSGMRAVADEFVAARLLVADRDPATREPTIEVAHEALLTRWSRLVDWVEDDRRWLTQLQHLAAAGRAWDDGGRLDTELYRGSRLEAAIEAIDIDGRAVSGLEGEFVEAGRRARDAEIRVARRTAHRLRRLLVAAVTALVVALVAGALAFVQRRQADDNAAEAQAQAGRAETAAVEAQIEALVGRAESLRQTQRDTAALLSVEAYRLADTPRTRSVLLGTFTDQAGFYDARRLEGRGGGAGIVMPDGAAAYIVDDARRLRPYGLETGSLGDPLPAIGDAPGGISVLAASADGRWLAQAWRSDVGEGPTTVGVLDTSTGSLRFPPLAVEGTVWSAVFTPDAGELAVAIDEEARLLVVDSATGAELGSAPGVTVPAVDGVVGMEPQAGSVGPTRRPPAVAAAGDELLLGAADGSLRIFDAATFELRRTVALAPDTLASIRPLDDGTVLTAGRRGVTRVDPDSGRVLWQHEQGVSAVGDGASGATCTHLALIEQRGTFYCGNAYGRLAEHDLGSGYAIRVLDAQNGNSGTLWPARDGTELVSFADNEPVVSRWRLDGSGPITHLIAPGFRGWSFNPGSDLLIVEQRGGVLEGYPSNIIDVESGEIVHTLDGLVNADWLDDDTVTGAIVNDDGSVETAHIDLAAGELVADGVIVDPIPNRAVIDLGKQRMLVVFNDGPDATITQFDPRTERIGPEISVDGYVSSAISRSGHRIAAGTERGVEIYDGFTGEQVGAIAGTDLRGVFITVTDQLFVSSLGGQLTLYDLDTLEPIRSFGGSRGHITQLHGTADGTLIATNGGDHSVILYDVASGVRIGTPITIADDESNWIALSLDGQWLSIGGEPFDGTHATQIWDLEPEQWASAACRVAGRNLTREEWASNIGALAPYRATCSDLPSDA